MKYLEVYGKKTTICGITTAKEWRRKIDLFKQFCHLHAENLCEVPCHTNCRVDFT